ncbi:hypothetical protein BpHYR1_011566 [Brachionus plicatilis]|uniref:Uncharacterized protein n=1 Tax=Brachionus plicatilis TaxID=10195 RepID=A0A3M7SUM4_BRAPC|nr:hypothetical protein BpHYR1_011566 [Brachionus plicatilis]
MQRKHQNTEIFNLDLITSIKIKCFCKINVIDGKKKLGKIYSNLGGFIEIELIGRNFISLKLVVFIFKYY